MSSRETATATLSGQSTDHVQLFRFFLLLLLLLLAVVALCCLSGAAPGVVVAICCGSRLMLPIVIAKLYRFPS